MFIKMSHAVIMNFHYPHHDNNLIGITESITNLLYPVKTRLATAGYVENGSDRAWVYSTFHIVQLSCLSR